MTGRVYFNIMGDETTDPEQFVHCAKCLRVCEGGECEEWVCKKCGRDLTGPESVVTGREIREKREAIDRQMMEWTELNKAPKS